jgi:hypothetical protein
MGSNQLNLFLEPATQVRCALKFLSKQLYVDVLLAERTSHLKGLPNLSSSYSDQMDDLRYSATLPSFKLFTCLTAIAQVYASVGQPRRPQL